MGCLFNNKSFPSFPASRFEECEGVVREQDFNTRNMLGEEVEVRMLTVKRLQLAPVSSPMSHNPLKARG